MMPTHTAIITGAYGAIGKAIARKMAEKNYRTVLAGRDEKKLLQAADEIKKQTGNEHVSYELVDLSRKSSIEAFSKRWEGPLHVLINNAATGPRKRTETPEGIEMQWATNVLGYFWMTRFFSGFMNNLEDARVVDVASYWAGGLDLSDLEFRRREYDNDAAYRQSKQANRMLSVAYAERLAPFGITVNACLSGDVNSKLSNSFGFGGHESPDEGAATPVWLAAAPELKGVTGHYFEHLHETGCPFVKDKKAVERLFEICQGY
jgi:NAD(P)-dependent dehydrogenase (short-subunit alcohol dehydrogenase family)